MNSLKVISSPPVSGRTDRLAREWIVKFAELYSASLADKGPRFVELWVSALTDLQPSVLDAACQKAIQSCKFFPMPAEIRAQIATAESKGFELEAEGEWQKLLTWIRRNYFPDTGIRRGAASLKPAVEHAARAAGGFRYIESCPEEQLVWCRRTFLAAYKNVHETGQAEHLLSDSEAKRILEQFRLATTKSADDTRQIAAKPTETKASRDEKGIPREEVREVLTKIATEPRREEKPDPTDQERQQRKESMRHALDVQENYRPEDLDDWLAKHGLQKPANLITALPVTVEKPISLAEAR